MEQRKDDPGNEQIAHGMLAQDGPRGFVVVRRVRVLSEAEHWARGREILATVQNRATAEDHARLSGDEARRWTTWLRLVVRVLGDHEGRYAQVCVPAGPVAERVCGLLTRRRAGEDAARFAVRVGASLTPEFVSLTVWAVHRDS